MNLRPAPVNGSITSTYPVQLGGSLAWCSGACGLGPGLDSQLCQLRGLGQLVPSPGRRVPAADNRHEAGEHLAQSK